MYRFLISYLYIILFVTKPACAADSPTFDIRPLSNFYTKDPIKLNLACKITTQNYIAKPSTFGFSIIEAEPSGWVNLKDLPNISIQLLPGITSRQEIAFEVQNTKTGAHFYTAAHYLWPKTLLSEMMAQINKNILEKD